MLRKLILGFVFFSLVYPQWFAIGFATDPNLWNHSWCSYIRFNKWLLCYSCFWADSTPGRNKFITLPVGKKCWRIWTGNLLFLSFSSINVMYCCGQLEFFFSHGIGRDCIEVRYINLQMSQLHVILALTWGCALYVAHRRVLFVTTELWLLIQVSTGIFCLGSCRVWYISLCKHPCIYVYTGGCV